MQPIESDISKDTSAGHEVRGRLVVDLMKKHTLVQVLFLLWRGDMPTKEEEALVNSMFVAMAEHGTGAPSVFVPRVVASTGNTMNAALAASALSVGDTHGGAIESAMRMLVSQDSPSEIVEDALRHGERIPGIGHKVYTDEDPRATVVRNQLRELGFDGTYMDRMYEIASVFEKEKGKKLPVNVDGAVAAGMSELGFDPVFGKACFIVPRLIGAAAHVAEESVSKGYRRL